MLQPRPKPARAATPKMEAEECEEDVKDEPAEGSTGLSPTPPHTCGAPVNRPNQWSFYSSMEEVDQLIDALNPRGHRESSLKEALLQERERINQVLLTCDRNKYTHTDDPESSRSVPECTAAAETFMEVRLRDLLLDIEDRIHQGTLGTLKVMDRQVWRSALEVGNYEKLSEGRENGGMNGRVEAVEVETNHLRARDRLQELRSDPGASGASGCGTPQVVSSSVRILAQALTHIEQGIERRFLKAPLDGSDSGRVIKTVLERWRESLQSCSSLSQVFVHLSTLERSILWSSGKKATPPTSKDTTASGSKAPPRSGSRSSARLSHEILAPNGSMKTSPDVTLPAKRSRPVLPLSSSSSPSSSSRRSSGRNHGVHELSACEQLTVELVRHEDSWPFMKLVSRTQVPDYYDIIKKPIALSTIREKVNNCEYQTAGEFISDVDLMFSNCLQYNPRHTNEAKAGLRLQHFFHSELGRLGLSERGSAPPAKRSRH
ncbi:hypothetical protein INR49_031437 [Caranx melampygus]|nr:hypothetical protein INR49_031437 [Caranx melampygus]